MAESQRLDATQLRLVPSESRQCLALFRDETARARLSALWTDAEIPDLALTTALDSDDDVAHAPAAVLYCVDQPDAEQISALRARFASAALVVVTLAPGPAMEHMAALAGADYVLDRASLSAGQLRRGVAVALDLRATALQLEVEQARTEDWSAAASDWFWELGPDLRFTYMAGRLGELSGLDAGAMIGTRLGQGLQSPAPQETHHEAFRNVIHPVTDREGQQHWLKVSGRPLFDRTGEFQGYRGTSVDITDEVMAAKQSQTASMLLQDALDSLPQAVALFDASERLVLVNERFANDCDDDSDLIRPGISLSDLLSERLRRGHFPDALGREAEWLAKQRDAWRDPGAAETHRVRGGRWVAVTMRPTCDGGALLVHTDVTTERRSELELRTSEARFRAIFERNLLGVIVLDDDGRVREINPAGLKLFEAGQPADVIGHELSEYVEGHYRTTLRSSVVAQTETQVHAFEMRSLYGQRRWVEMVMTPLALPEAVSGQLCVLRDISAVRADQMRMTRVLRILDESTNEVYMFDARRLRFTQVNRRARNNLGYSLDELTRMTPVDIAPHLGERTWATLLRPLSSGTVDERRLETEFQRKDGSRYPVEAFFRLSQEESPTYVAIVLDVTERKRSEEDLLQAQKLEAVGQLAGGVAHDFNNVLTVIGGNLRLLAREVEQEAANEDWSAMLSDALSATQRAGDLTRSLLSIARKESVELSQIDVVAAVTEAGNLLRRTLPAAISLEVDTLDCTGTAYSNRTFLHTALLNLGLNARDAMPRGGELVLSATDVDVGTANAARLSIQPGRYIRVAVRDSGHGMSADVRGRIFEPLFSTKPTGKGTGLGLTMVHGFARDCGGTVEVESELGQGTAFSMYLPVFSLDEPRYEPDDRSTVWQSRIAGTVLLVDDEPALRGMVARGLNRLGATTLEAPSADAALQILRTGRRIDVVLTDLQMEGEMDGLDLALRLVKSDSSPAVVLMSGDEGSLRRAEREAAKDIPLLRKPFTIEELIAALPAAVVRQ